MFSDKVFRFVQEKYQGELGELIIEDVRIGTFLAAVKLSNGLYGVASVIRNNVLHQVAKKNRDYGDFTPLHICGKKVSSLFDHLSNSALVQILKIAVLNAYFHQFVDGNNYIIQRNTDPINLLNLNDFEEIVMVGAFNSYIHQLSSLKAVLQVLELDEKAFLPEHVTYYVPADQYEAVLPGADLVIITGLTLVNNTFDKLLDHIPSGSTSIIIGPSSAIVPDLFFERQIDMIGGTIITEPEKLFPLVSQGAAAYHLFQYCAEKITISRV